MILKKYAPFTHGITDINNTKLDTAKNPYVEQVLITVIQNYN